MRCDEVKRRLNEKTGLPDGQLTAHLRTCPQCARAAEAARILDRLLIGAKEDMTLPSLETTRNRVEWKAANQTKGKRIMSDIQHHLNARPRLWFAAGVAVMTLFFILVVPFSITRTIGYEVSISGIDIRGAVSPALLAASMTTLGYIDLDITTSGSGSSSRYTISKIPTREEAEDIARTFVLVLPTSQTSQVTVRRLEVAASEPLFAQVVNRMTADESPRMHITFENGQILINGTRYDEIFHSRKATDAEVQALLDQLLIKINRESSQAPITARVSSNDDCRTVEFTTGDADDEILVSALKMDITDGTIALMSRHHLAEPDERDTGRIVLSWASKAIYRSPDAGENAKGEERLLATDGITMRFEFPKEGDSRDSVKVRKK